MEKILQEIYSNSEFIEIIIDILKNDTVKQMKNFRQHYNTSCFDHCLIASYYCYKSCKKLKLDYKSCARAAMLHDLFLYDWRKKAEINRKGLHAFSHPKTSFENAQKLFTLNKKEKDIILKHMWPVTISFPKYKESYILTIVDKYCAVNETIFGILSSMSKKKIYRYTYVFLCLLFLKY